MQSAKITCGAAESTGVTQVREELAAAHVIEQHVEEGLIVMGPYPVRWKFLKSSRARRKMKGEKHETANASHMFTMNG